MKTLTPTFGVLGVVAILLLSGCVSFDEPGYSSGSLVYYDVADAGATWCWEDDFGWRYLGEYDLDLSRPCPPWGWPHRRPVDNRRHHHRPPPRPGEHPHPGSRPCYFYFHHDGSVLTGADGTHFNRIGHLNHRNEFVRNVDPTPFNGSFSGRGNRFHVGPIGPVAPRPSRGTDFAEHTPSPVPNHGARRAPSPDHVARPGFADGSNHPSPGQNGGGPRPDLHRSSPGGDHVNSRPPIRRDGNPPAVTDRNRGNTAPAAASGGPRSVAPSGNSGNAHSGGNRWSGGSPGRTADSSGGNRSAGNTWSGRSSGGSGNSGSTQNHAERSSSSGTSRSSSSGNPGADGRHRPDSN